MFFLLLYLSLLKNFINKIQNFLFPINISVFGVTQLESHRKAGMTMTDGICTYLSFPTESDVGKTFSAKA